MKKESSTANVISKAMLDSVSFSAAKIAEM
jgi:hypothetical protein